MRYTVAIALLLISTFAFAQDKSWNNWYFGYALGVNFDGGNRSLFSNSKVYTNYGSACISDPVTAQFLFMTDGKKCYDRNFAPMSIDLGLTLAVYSFIVPFPGDNSKFYVFATDNSHTIFYTIVDMALRNGFGDVTAPFSPLKTNVDLHFTAVKRLYDDGYWLITHTYGTDEFQVFAITADGINPNPVTSKTGRATSGIKDWVYGNMVSNKTGEVLVHAAEEFVQAFNFDKSCGRLFLKYDLYPTGSSTGSAVPSAAYSLSNKYLYISWGKSLYQYDMTQTDPNASSQYLGSGIRDNVRLALAPDGLIYGSSAENGAVTSKVSVIYDADKSTAFYKINDVDLKITTDYRYMENWPPFITDWAEPDIPGFEMPIITVDGKCTENDVSFSVDGNFQNDSLYWDLGNGDTIHSEDFNYKYTNPAKYEVTFNWYLCGFKYSLKDTIDIGNRPVFSLGNDTTICNASELILAGPANTESYSWSGGQLSDHIKINKAGLYWLRAGNGECFSSDTILIQMNPPVLVELGQDHFLCEDRDDFEKLDAGKGFDAYKWTPTGDTTQWILVRKEGDYYVIVRDFHGCPGQDGTTVERRCPVMMQLPNAFSPNGDNVNDEFKPVYSDVVSYRLVIYNRWGEKIFEANDPVKGWDGLFKNAPAPNEVYIYNLIYSGYDEKDLLQSYTRSGTIHLLR